MEHFNGEFLPEAFFDDVLGGWVIRCENIEHTIKFTPNLSFSLQ